MFPTREDILRLMLASRPPMFSGACRTHVVEVTQHPTGYVTRHVYVGPLVLAAR